MNNSTLTLAGAFVAGVIVGALGYRYLVVEKKIDVKEIVDTVEKLSERAKRRESRMDGGEGGFFEGGRGHHHHHA